MPQGWTAVKLNTTIVSALDVSAHGNKEAVARRVVDELASKPLSTVSSVKRAMPLASDGQTPAEKARPTWTYYDRT